MRPTQKKLSLRKRDTIDHPKPAFSGRRIFLSAFITTNDELNHFTQSRPHTHLRHSYLLFKRKLCVIHLIISSKKFILAILTCKTIFLIFKMLFFSLFAL